VATSSCRRPACFQAAALQDTSHICARGHGGVQARCVHGVWLTYRSTTEGHSSSAKFD
jgi:hypothetical protein